MGTCLFAKTLLSCIFAFLAVVAQQRASCHNIPIYGPVGSTTEVNNDVRRTHTHTTKDCLILSLNIFEAQPDRLHSNTLRWNHRCTENMNTAILFVTEHLMPEKAVACPFVTYCIQVSFPWNVLTLNNSLLWKPEIELQHISVYTDRSCITGLLLHVPFGL
jgi:hypothetical protein